MSADKQPDDFVVIRIEGMHCHRCEQAIQKSIKRLPRVNEVEVDFPTAQASVLFDPKMVAVADLMTAVTQAGYKTAGFTRKPGQN